VRVEMDEETVETFDKAIGLATYSNSGSTFFAYTSIFENLWMQTERTCNDPTTTIGNHQKNKNILKTRRSNTWR
jgi:hypothetical protein